MNPIDQIEYACGMIEDAHRRISELLDTTTGKQRGELWQAHWDALKILDRHPLCLSQSGQDHFIDSILTKQRRGGTFVDVGGYDGVTGSNSFFFEVCRAWNGLLIEPVESRYVSAASVRRCRCLNLCVCGDRGPHEFLRVCDGFTQMSGLMESYDPSTLDQVRSHPDHREESYSVEGVTLSEILEREAIDHIDCLFMDIEGAETAVLESFSFSRYSIDVCCIENATGGETLSELMRGAGYQLVDYIGVDEIFVRPEFLSRSQPLDGSSPRRFSHQPERIGDSI